jgi:subtilase family serine protease
MIGRVSHAHQERNLRVGRLGITFFFVTLLTFVFTLSLYAQAAHAAERWTRPVLTQEIDEGKRVALMGNTRPEANATNDRGLVADDFPLEHILLQLQRSSEQEQALTEFIDQLHNPTSANFHQWLTAQEFGERFGLAEADLNRITTWLTRRGFQVNVVYPSGMVIDFSGSAGQLREAFGTEIHHLEVKGMQHLANLSDPEIPAALAPAVVGIVSLHDFTPRVMHKLRGDYTFTSGGSVYQAVVPADLATIYNLNPLFIAGISGQGQTIAVIEDTNVYNVNDWNTFRATFGLLQYPGTFKQVQPPPSKGANNCGNPGVNADDGEAILDAEWASAAAPGAAIVLASCANTRTTFGGLIALQNLISGSSPPSIISISYGECEASNGAAANAAYNSVYQQAVTMGISVFVAAGDEGAASCDAGAAQATHGIGVSGFASTPYNVAVGGTDFGDTVHGLNTTYWSPANGSYYGSALSYIPEIPWNDSCASTLLANYLGYPTTYGSSGFCSSSAGQQFLEVIAGSGGPSGCATGAPSTAGVVGGSCKGYAKPSWQFHSVYGNPADGVRDIPDVSLFAANGLWGHYYVICWSDVRHGGAPCSGAPSTWSGAGGTSFSSPIMAGIQALVNQKWGRQGNPNYVYYSIAASEYGSGSTSCNSTNGNSVGPNCIFYDVAQGDMDVRCRGSHNCYLPSGRNGVLSTSSSSYSPAYGATTGWDFATGIGTVNANNLVNSSAW